MFTQHIVVICLLVFHLNQMTVKSAVADEGRKVAMLVGIDIYPKPGLNDLKYAERDVDEVGEELTTLGFDVTVIKGEDATRRNLIETAKRLVSPLSKRDLVLVMLCGHGTQRTVSTSTGNARNDVFFCPYDAVINETKTLFSLSSLIDETLGPNVGRKMLLVDACRNDPNPGRGIREIDGSVITLPENTSVMFSCRKGQVAIEIDEFMHGLFTYTVLEGLRGRAAKKGVITWSSLLAHVEECMTSDEFKRFTDGKQQEVICKNNLARTILGKREYTDSDSRHDSPSFHNNSKQPSAQIRLLGPEGMRVDTFEQKVLKPDEENRAPMKVRLERGKTHRLRFTDIPGEEGLELYPVVTLPVGDESVDEFLLTNLIDIRLTSEEIRFIQSGRLLEMALFEPDSKFAELEFAGIEDFRTGLSSAFLPPGLDVVSEADRRGHVLCVLRVGKVDLGADNQRGLDIVYKSVERRLNLNSSEESSSAREPQNSSQQMECTFRVHYDQRDGDAAAGIRVQLLFQPRDFPDSTLACGEGNTDIDGHATITFEPIHRNVEGSYFARIIQDDGSKTWRLENATSQFPDSLDWRLVIARSQPRLPKSGQRLQDEIFEKHMERSNRSTSFTVSSTDEAIEQVLDRKVTLDFPGNPLEEVAESISRRHGVEVEFHPSVLAAGIDPRFEQVETVVSGISLRSALRILLERIPGDPLTYRVDRGKIIILDKSFGR